MAYQASVGQKVFYSTASSMTNMIELTGLTATPAKGGEPNTVSVNIISEPFVRQLVGQQEMQIMAYELAPDFATGESVDKMLAAIAASRTADVWIYEEYEVGTDTTSGGTTTHTLGAGIIYKGRFKSSMFDGQQGNGAQAASLYAQLTGKSIYVASGGTTQTYKDAFTGATVTTLE